MDTLGLGSGAGAQHQVVILAALVAGTKAADRVDQGASIDPEMRKHVLRQHQIGVPVRFEIRIVSVALSVDLVLVAEDQIEFRLLRQRRGYRVKRMLGQSVVMIEKGDELPLGHRETTVAEGEFVALLDHDDRLPEHALYTVAA